MELNRVVVTGLGALTPLGNSVEETWKNILEGKSGAAPITLFDPSKFRTQFACEVKGFKAADYIDRKDARKMDRCTQLGVAAAVQAVADSKIDLDTVDKNRVGVVYGIGIGGIPRPRAASALPSRVRGMARERTQTWTLHPHVQRQTRPFPLGLYPLPILTAVHHLSLSHSNRYLIGI